MAAKNEVPSEVEAALSSPKIEPAPQTLKEAREGDIVILAGKGHETYQVLKDKTIDFDDRAVAREVLKGYGYHKTQ